MSGSTPHRSIRVIKAAERLEAELRKKNDVPPQGCDILRLDELRAYLVERRRAVLTELDALNTILKTE